MRWKVESLAEFIGIMSLIWFIVRFFWWILAVLALMGFFFLMQAQIRKDRAQQAADIRRHAEVAARAEAQHHWVLQGDDRGVYGDYPIPLIVKESLPWWVLGSRSEAELPNRM